MAKKTVNTRAPRNNGAPANVSPNAPQSPTQNENVGNDIFYHFKADAYVDDDPKSASQLVRAGFYRTGRVLPRFEGKKIPDVVKFDSRPDDVFIADIARSLGFHIVAGMKYDYDELLEKITSVFPY